MTPTGSDHPAPALTRAECRPLLGCGVIGRILYTTGALPAAQPVRYALRAGEIIFRTADGILRADR